MLEFHLPPLSDDDRALQAWLNARIEAAIEAKYRRLEEEGRILMACGYRPDELAIVTRDDGSAEVLPKQE